MSALIFLSFMFTLSFVFPLFVIIVLYFIFYTSDNFIMYEILINTIKVPPGNQKELRVVFTNAYIHILLFSV